MKKRFYFLMPLLIFSLTSCRNIQITGDDTVSSTTTTQNNEESYKSVDYTTNVLCNYNFTDLGTVKRTIPVISNEGLEKYPTYGTDIELTDDEKDAILSEDTLLRASDTTYNSMDKDGNLYLNDVSIGRKLYKHTSSVGMYYGNLNDSEEAIIRNIEINAKRDGNYLTGLYAPAGEVIKIEMSEEDLEATGGVTISIGQCSIKNVSNNIWKARTFCRMPNQANFMTVDSKTSYVGSYLGGPIYVTPKNKCKFDITISGACKYATFIYGYTTEDEFDEEIKSSAPYFDLEVGDNIVRHSGEKKYANLDYDNLMKVSKLWESFSTISRQIPGGSNSNILIDFLYEPFVAAGGAVAFVGGNWCNLPSDWLTSSINYETFTKDGMWGTIHEYDHHFQQYGLEPGDEVTNNAINLLNYISFTNISQNRNVDSKLSGWNRYLDPEISLSETLAGTTTQSSLNTYADIIHTFGVDTFIKVANYQNRVGGADSWYEALCETTGYDFSYYFSLIGQTVSEDLLNKYKDNELYIPVASGYQVGRTINTNGKSYDNVILKPYKINKSGECALDFNNHLIVPSGVTYEIESVTSPANGTISKLSKNLYSYKSNGNNLSGEFKVNIKLIKDSKEYHTSLILNLETDDKALNETTYTYESDIYNNLAVAYANNYQGYSSVKESYISADSISSIKKNTITIISGKIYCDSTKEYTFGIKGGSGNTFLYTYDGTNYNLACYINGSSGYNKDGTNTFIVNQNEGDYIYFKLVVLAKSDSSYARIGIYENDSWCDLSTNYILANENTYQKYSFTYDDIYPYEYDCSFEESDSQTLVSTDNYTPWDDNYVAKYMIDNNSSTSGHTRNYASETEPISITVDLGKITTVNTLEIVGYNRTERHLPITFNLYGGKDSSNLILIQSYENLDSTNRDLFVTFSTTSLRYYKVEVLKTDTSKYFAAEDIKMYYKSDSKIYSADVASYISYYIDNSKLSTFGHTISTTSKVKLNIESDSFGMCTRNNETVKIRLTIDGATYELELNQNTDIQFMYELTRGSHEIYIEVLDGTLNIDSFIY